MSKKYWCSPAAVLPLIFAVSFVFFLMVPYIEYRRGFTMEPMEWLYWGCFLIISLSVAIWTNRIGGRYVLICPKRIICKALFCRDIVIEYDKCNIGIDYSNNKGCRQWWIYLSYIPYPPFKKDAYYNRINSRYCKQGFIRIMYNDDIYQALMDVLPKKQRIALAASYSLHIARYKD